MPKIPIIKAKEFLYHLQQYGCVSVRAKGSHHKIRNPLNNETSILPIHGGADLKPGLFAKILKDLRIDAAGFIGFITNKK
jgi:predicted RNA binding protein YcfA (HicA-like mRNA interferase family)